MRDNIVNLIDGSNRIGQISNKKIFGLDEKRVEYLFGKKTVIIYV